MTSVPVGEAADLPPARRGTGPVLRSLVLVAVLSLGAACANPDLGTAAGELDAELADLPGVASVRLDYGEPVPLDSGKLALRVEMSGTATADEVVAVAETAYDAFSTTHRGEEANLAVRTGRTTVALRSFEPEASTTAVGDAVRTGLAAASGPESVAVDLTTDGVAGGDHVAGTYLVSLPGGSTYADVPALLASLAARHPDDSLVGWGGVASDGASLSYDSGFPPALLVDRWERLQEAGLPLAVRAYSDGPLIAEGRLTDRPDVDDPADRRALDEITHPQLLALGDGAWVYTVRGPGGASLAEIDRLTCVATAEGPYDEVLEAWFTATSGPCVEQ